MQEKPMPMFHLSFLPYENVPTLEQLGGKLVEEFNTKQIGTRKVMLTCNPHPLTAQETKSMLDYVDSLSVSIYNSHKVEESVNLLLLRAIGRTIIQDLESAVADLTTCLNIDSSAVLAYWQRAVCLAMQSQFNSSQGIDAGYKTMQALRDMDSAIELMPEVSYLYYDRANIYYIRNDFRSAIEDYSRAIRLNPNLAEAYYNRGLTRILNGDRNLGIADLQKAGDLGLYSAYGVISRRK